jgi:hypothetical protein
VLHAEVAAAVGRLAALVEVAEDAAEVALCEAVCPMWGVGACRY